MTLKIKTGGAFVDVGGSGGSGSVDSFAGRTGVVIPQQGDYSAGQISGLSDALAGKQNVLPTGGVAGQFLAYDLTWRTVASTAPAWGSITGTIANQTDLTALLATKVNVVAGKQLSTEDFTTVEKQKLAAIEVNATANRTDTATDAAITTAINNKFLAPVPVPVFTDALVPPAASHPNAMVFIDDGTDTTLSYSDGTNWIAL